MATKPFPVGLSPVGASDLNTLLGAIDVVTTEVDVVNDATERQIYSELITGGKLGSDRSLLLWLWGDYLNNSGANRTLTPRVKFGTSTLWAATASAIPPGANRTPFEMLILLANRGLTNSQLMRGVFKLGRPDFAPTTGIGDLDSSAAAWMKPFGGTSAEDTIADRTLQITVQHSVANANLSLRMQYAKLWLD